MIYSVWEREYSGPEFAAVHLLTVDAYALQHGECFGARSNAFHLMRLCWLIELGGTERGGSSRLHRRKFEEAYRSFPNLAPPEDRGALTVAHVCGMEDPGEHARKVKEWASVVWEAWAEHRGWALRYRKAGKAFMSLYPCEDGLTVQVILTDQEVARARALNLSERVRALMEGAHPYPEGRWLFIPTTSRRGAEEVKRLLTVKSGQPEDG